jgi:cytoskeletal protein CcmA (bactofilin family)
MWNQEGAVSTSGIGAQHAPAPVAGRHLPDERRRTAWIGKSVAIRGDVVSAEDLSIDGQVDGTIVVGDHNLTIGVGAVIHAQLNARTILISGSVTGNVIAADRIEIRETGSVEGELKTPRLAVREGAVVRGRIDTSVALPGQRVAQFPQAV